MTNKKTSKSSNFKKNHLNNQLSPMEVADKWQELKDSKFILEQEIEESIPELLELIRNYSPLPFIFSIFCNTNVKIPGEGEPKNEIELKAEYAQSLVMAVPNHGTEEPGRNEQNRFYELIEKIISNVSWLFLTKEPPPNLSLSHLEIKMMGMQKYLLMRGSSYDEHESDLIFSLFSPHDEVLHNKFGFKTQELINFYKKIEKNTLDHLRRQREFYRDFMRLCINVHDNNPGFSNEETMAFVSHSKELQNLKFHNDKAMPEKYAEFLVPSGFDALCKYLSMEAGDNHHFLSTKYSPGWPSNDTGVQTKPLIKQGGNFFCPNPTLFLRNRINILESAIKGVSQKYFSEKYSKSRGVLLEKLALEYLQSILPKAKVYQSLYYRMDEKGKKKFEADGLIILDDHLFIIEAKAAPLSVKSLRGGDRGLKKDLNRILKTPYQQGLRTLEFIKNNSKASFEKSNGTPLVDIKYKDFKKIYIINVTLADISHITTNLSLAKEMGFIEGEEYPWSVFINDLRVISEIIDSPSEFLLFLENRLKINKIPSIRGSDELELFGYFLQNGLFFDSEPKEGRVFLLGFSKKIDQYYESLANPGTLPPEKPKLLVSDWFKELACAIERTGYPNCYTVAKEILSIERLEKPKIENCFHDFMKKSKADAAILMFANPNQSILAFSLLKNINFSQITDQERFIKMKQFQMGCSKSLLITIVGEDMDHIFFQYIDKEIKINNKLRYELSCYVNGKWHQYNLQNKSKPAGQNQTCPCESGQKYKHCCLGKYFSNV